MARTDLPAVRRAVAALVALTLACAVAACGGPAVPSRWDDFRRPDGPLTRGAPLPSGQAWQTSFAADPAVAAAALRIAGGGLRFDAAGAAYAWTTGDGDPDAAAVDFAFLPGAVDAGANALGLLVSARPGPDIVGPGGLGVNSVHAVFGTTTWTVSLGTGDGLDPVATGTYRLVPDGRTVHHASLVRTGANTLVVGVPDGTTRTVTDPRIAALWGPSVLVEHYQPGSTTDARPLVTGYRVLP